MAGETVLNADPTSSQETSVDASETIAALKAENEELKRRYEDAEARRARMQSMLAQASKPASPAPASAAQTQAAPLLPTTDAQTAMLAARLDALEKENAAVRRKAEILDIFADAEFADMAYLRGQVPASLAPDELKTFLRAMRNAGMVSAQPSAAVNAAVAQAAGVTATQVVNPARQQPTAANAAGEDGLLSRPVAAANAQGGYVPGQVLVRSGGAGDMSAVSPGGASAVPVDGRMTTEQIEAEIDASDPKKVWDTVNKKIMPRLRNLTGKTS